MEAIITVISKAFIKDFAKIRPSARFRVLESAVHSGYARKYFHFISIVLQLGLAVFMDSPRSRERILALSKLVVVVDTFQ